MDNNRYCRTSNGSILANDKHELASCIVSGLNILQNGHVQKDGVLLTSDVSMPGQCVFTSYVSPATRDPLLSDATTTLQKMIDAKIFIPSNVACTTKFNKDPEKKPLTVDNIVIPPSWLSATLKPDAQEQDASKVETGYVYSTLSAKTQTDFTRIVNDTADMYDFGPPPGTSAAKITGNEIVIKLKMSDHSGAEGFTPGVLCSASHHRHPWDVGALFIVVLLILIEHIRVSYLKP